jgi:YD repeat-containing protein
VLTAADPRGNVTNGRPLTIIDPNGVTTSLTYDLRGRLTSRTVGTLKTAYAYNKTGNLNTATQPDGSYLAYDMAHRLIGIADAAGDHIAYTLDATSNLIMEQSFDPSGMLSRTRSYGYNAVNRLKETIGAQGRTTVYAHDKQAI